MSTEHPLRAWRKRNHKTLEDIAKELGVGRSHISCVELSKHGLSLSRALKIEAMTGGEVKASDFNIEEEVNGGPETEH